jgi:hypothetical protein
MYPTLNYTHWFAHQRRRGTETEDSPQCVRGTMCRNSRIKRISKMLIGADDTQPR